MTPLLLLTVLLASLCQAQYFPLKNVQPPSSHALATVARFFVYSRHDSVSTSPLPSFGWGFWDKHYALPAKMMTHQLSYEVGSQALDTMKDDAYLDMAIMEYDSFWSKFVPYQQENHFCCTKADVARGECEEEHGLLLPPDLRNNIFLMRVPINRAGGPTTDGSVAEADYHVPKTGIYFLMFVNCGTELPKGHVTGAVLARGAHGMLSGMDVPKLELYAIGAMVYAALGMFWLVWCLRYKRQLIALHHMIGAVIGLGFLEQMAWLTHLSWANVVSPPSDILLIVAIAASVLKNVSACLLVLVASLGYCITRPTLEGTTVAKIWAGAIALAVLDTARQLATHFHVSLDLSVIILMVCALPITLLYASGFVWAFYSLNALVEELKVRRQTAKMRQMNRFRCVLIFASLCFVASTFVETYVLSVDIRKVWTYEWIFTDAVPIALFTLILAVTVFLWRPTRSSKFYSYNLQLPDHENDSALDIDRIRADVPGKAFEVTFDSPSTTGATDHRPEIRPWGEIELDMEDEDEREAPVAERQVGRRV